MRSLARLDATLLACAFSVFGRPLSGGREIGDVNGDPPFFSPDWRSTALSFLPTLSDLSSQVNPAPFFGSFAPDTLSEVKQDVPTNQFGSDDTQSYKLGFDEIPNPIGLGDTVTDQNGLGDNMLPNIASTDSAIPEKGIKNDLEQMRIGPVRYCLYQISIDSQRLEFATCGIDPILIDQTNWDNFGGQFHSFRPGFAVYLLEKDRVVPENNIAISLMNLVNRDATVLEKTEEILKSWEQSWTALVKQAFPRIVTEVKPIRGESDLRDVGRIYSPD
ncbi:hypothetical protein MMC29_001796 [Sticta canariensis]|nr:hypothetical protein [Sticta canariensis]